MKILCGVYKITSAATGKFYHGSSKNMRARKRGHLKALASGDHINQKLQKLYDKYGASDLTFTVVKLLDRGDAYKLEDKLIRKNLQNKKALTIGMRAVGGDNLTRNGRRTEIIAQIKTTMHKNIAAMTQDERDETWGRPGELNGMYGNTHTKKVRKILSDAMLGNQKAVGRITTPEARENYRKSALARVAADDYVNSFAGKVHTKKTKQLLSELNKGKLPPNTRRVRIGKKTYVSMTAAARKLGVVTATILNRIRSKNYPDYSYVD